MDCPTYCMTPTDKLNQSTINKKFCNLICLHDKIFKETQ
jgi:hypothetical protein